MIPSLAFREIALGPLTIQVWGLCAALGFALALFLSLREARRKGIGEDVIWDVMLIALLAMVVGARIFYALWGGGFAWDILLDAHAGFTLLGGALLALLGGSIYLRHRRQNVGRVLDALTPGLVVALLGARTGCLLVNDHLGSLTQLPWGMEYSDGSVRHPVALYHLFFLGLILVLISRRKNRPRPDGRLFFSFAVLYALGAFLADFSRCADLAFCEPRFFLLTATQWILLIFLLTAPVFRKILRSGKVS